MNPSPLAGIDLHDIHGAPPPAFWPPAPGWWILALIVLIAFCVISWRLYRAWRQHHQEARILSELNNLADNSPEQFATEVSTLLRRVALMRYTRQEVAPLNGEAWLAFLDRTGGNGEFVHGAGNVLAIVPYANVHTLTGFDKDALLDLARDWLKQNLRRRA